MMTRCVQVWTRSIFSPLSPAAACLLLVGKYIWICIFLRSRVQIYNKNPLLLIISCFWDIFHSISGPGQTVLKRQNLVFGRHFAFRTTSRNVFKFFLHCLDLTKVRDIVLEGLRAPDFTLSWWWLVGWLVGWLVKRTKIRKNSFGGLWCPLMAFSLWGENITMYLTTI